MIGSMSLIGLHAYRRNDPMRTEGGSMVESKDDRSSKALIMFKSTLATIARRILSVAALSMALAATSWAAPDSVTDTGRKIQAIVPRWVFPLNSPSPGGTPLLDQIKPLHVPGSRVTYTEAQLSDRFSVPDWFPESHSAMPEIVAKGRRPAVNACGYCHTPGGQGRPENASLAGLPAPYIVQQVADFKSGARRSASPDSYPPTDIMIDVATHATAAEVASAASYFSQQRPIQRVRVVERNRVPRSHVVGWVYAAIPESGDEFLEERLLEFAPDPARHEARDDKMQYIAYVPRGSVTRGRSIALTGAGGLTVACISCHGDRLQGMGLVPRIAGRSPTYLIRQLLAFQTGARAGVTGQPMVPVITRLRINDMIDVVAYAASLGP
jgi:cytochrome c553